MHLTDFKTPINTLYHTLSIAAFLVIGAIFFDHDIAKSLSRKSPSPRLVVNMLDFHNGHFRQIVSPKYRDVLQADWSASIRLGNTVICYGDGSHGYTPQSDPIEFTADGWTGGDCSALIPGVVYHASATWTNRDEYGFEHSIHEEFEFVYDIHERDGG